MADFSFDFGGGGFPSGFTLPSTFPGGGFDLGSVVALPVSVPTPNGFLTSINDLAKGITGAAQAYYGTQADIERAKAQAAIAKAQGVNAVQVAHTGLPSPYLLLAGGLGLVALIALTGRR